MGDQLGDIITPAPPHCQDHLGPNDTLPLAQLEWEKVSIPATIGLWIFFSSIARIGFSVSPLKKYIPESCVLICIGFIVGFVVLVTPGDTNVTLESDMFFLYLLPPIMLEAGYFMPMKAFFNNITTILLFAVVGTLFNAATIGLSLWAISEAGWLGFDEEQDAPIRISLLECFTFSSLISAVDPVAVIAVFEEIHVNQVLFILVFGESLLNDAVTVVLYRMFESFNEIGEDNLVAWDIYAGFLSFFIVGLGGVLVGAMFGFLAAFVSRFSHHTRVIEPVFVFIVSYLAYLMAEMLSLSSIMSIVSCAMVMKPYVEQNFSSRSITSTHNSIKMLSSISETIIFIFLGVSTLTERYNHQWNTAFVLYTLIFIFIYRLIGVLWQCALVNRFRIMKIGSTDMFIMAYGGIRGAIAFSLSALLCSNIVHANKIFFTTTIVVVMFTMFVQGITIKPIVHILDVKREEHREISMNEEIFSRVNDHALAGMELILGHEGQNHLRQRWVHFENKYVKQLLIRNYKKIRHHEILHVYQKLTEKAATDYIEEHGTFYPSHPPDVNSMQPMVNIPTIQNTSVISISSDEGNRSSFDDAPDARIVPDKARNDQISARQRHILSKSMFRPSRTFEEREPRRRESLLYRSMQIQLQHKMGHRQRKSGHTMKLSQDNGVPQLQPPWEQKPQAQISTLPPWLHEKEEAPPAPLKTSTLPPWLHHLEEDDDYDTDDDAISASPEVPIQESNLPWRRISSSGRISERASEDPHDGYADPPSASATVVNEHHEARHHPRHEHPQQDGHRRLEDISEDMEDEENGDKAKLLPGKK